MTATQRTRTHGCWTVERRNRGDAQTITITGKGHKVKMTMAEARDLVNALAQCVTMPEREMSR